jgi:hypothetical protein
MAGAVRVKGLKEMQRAFRKMDKDLSKELRSELRAAGNIVRDEARSLFSGIDARSASGYRTVVRQRGVAVEQRLPRTTGQHPSYGVLQMTRALEPALDTMQSKVIDRVDQMLDRLGGENGF